MYHSEPIANMNETYYCFLEKLFEYVKNNKKCSNHLYYTVTWHIKGNEKRYNSHFSACDLEELVAKFYTNKNKHDYIVDSIKNNPIS